MDLAGQVMARPEYTSASRVFVIVDNGSDHRGQAAIKRLAQAHPNAIMIHTPVHASWLNQIEIFSPSSRRRSSPRTTSTASANSSPRCWPSLTATTGRPAVQLEVHRRRPARPHGQRAPAATHAARTAGKGRLNKLLPADKRKHVTPYGPACAVEGARCVPEAAFEQCVKRRAVPDGVRGIHPRLLRTGPGRPPRGSARFAAAAPGRRC